MSAVINAVIDHGDVRREHLAKIKKLRNEFCEPLAVIEWRALPHEFKVVVCLMAGFDESQEAKSFAEFTPPEQMALKVQIRLMKRNHAPLMALTCW